MKRTIVTTTFAMALLGVAACKGGGADSAKLIPEAATVVGGIDVAGVLKSGVYTSNKELIESQGKDMLEAANACSLGLDKFKNITFGMDPKSKGFAAVINADGIGKEENINCIHGKIKEKDGGKEPWKLEEKDGKKVLTMEDGGVGYIVNEGSVVVASKDWAAGVKDLIDGKGKSVFDGALKDVIGRADTSKTIWFAGTVPADMLKGSPVDGAKDGAGSVDLSSGVALAASIGYASADDATKKKDELQKQFDAMKGTATGVGVPQSVVDSVKIEASGSAVTVSATATDADVKAIQDGVMKKM